MPVDAITYDEWMNQIGNWVDADEGAQHVCTVNPEFIIVARRDPIFFQHIESRRHLRPRWRRIALGEPSPGRALASTRHRLGWRALARAPRSREQGWKIFFLGAGEGIAEGAARILKAQHPPLIVSGTYSGSPAEREEDDIVALINASGADILLVAFGAPQQDKWIARNLPRLNVAMAMGVGGSFDFIAGVVPRAPQWMRDRGLEWLYRLLRQPWRMRRMLRLPRFVFAVLRQKHAR